MHSFAAMWGTYPGWCGTIYRAQNRRIGRRGYVMAGSTTVKGPLSPGDPAGHPGRRRRVVIWTAAALVAGAAMWGLWWFIHPTVFHPVNTEAWSYKYDNADMETVHIGMAYPKKSYWDSTVRLTDADPLVLENTADAEITIHVCHERGIGIGSVTGSLREYCKSILNLAAEPTLTLAPQARERLILTITPRRSGRVRIVGIDLTYRHGVQYGTQAVGEHVLARFRADPRQSS